VNELDVAGRIRLPKQNRGQDGCVEDLFGRPRSS
jgi:hypothetical protein